MSTYIHLHTALATIREIDPICRKHGYFCGLTGGVLLKGESYKDLDIMLMPLNIEELPKDFDGLVKVLKEKWGECATYEPYKEPVDESHYGTGLRSVSTTLVKFSLANIDLFVTKA